jgi:hypothetical protein
VEVKKLCRFEGCTNHSVKGGVCVTHGAKKKLCSFDGCTKQVQKGGVCYKHGSKSIITLNNPVLQSNAIPPSVPPHQAVDYDDEEELNSWIWRSSRMTRELGSSK